MRKVIPAILIICSSAFAPAQSLKQRALMGINSLEVLVESIDAEADLRGSLTRQGITTAIELRLRQLGVPVANNQGHYTLYVNINVMLAGPSVLYGIEVHLIEILNTGSPRGFIPVVTWTSGALGIRAFERAGDIRGRVIEIVDQFANDFLTANPPRLR